MQQFDTLKIAIPQKLIKSFNKDSFVRTEQFSGNSIEPTVKMQLQASNCPVGVSNILWHNGHDDLHLTCSAKVLKNDYLNGITKENWYRVFEPLNGIIDFDLTRVYDDAKVLKCDSTNNILLNDIGSTSQKEICAALFAAGSNMYFTKHNHTRGNNKLGIEFRGNQIVNKNRLIIYAKHLDLLKSANKAFLKTLNGNECKMMELAKKQLRFEVNHTDFKSMRQRFNVPENSFKLLLESTEPVNHNFLKKVTSTKDFKQTTLFDEAIKYKDFFLFLQYTGIKTIVRELNYDDAVIRNFFKEFLSDTQFKYHWHGKQTKNKLGFKNIVQNLKAEQYKISIPDSDSITNRVLTALKMAV